MSTRGTFRRWSPIPPAGQLRTLAWGTLANTVGLGLWFAGAALFLTRSVGLPATSVGLGLTVAGLIGLSASVPLGQLADRRDPRSLRALLQLLQAAVAASYLLVQSFPTFLLVAVVDALLAAGNLSVRAALVAAVAGPAGRVHAFATLRAVANIGISAGAALAGLALAADSRLGYTLLVLGNALTYLVSAGLVMRLPPLPPTPTDPGTAHRTALRDGRFLAVSAVSAVLASHSVVLGLVVPLWIATQTSAPRVTVSAVLVTNTVLTVFLTVRISRAVENAVAAARTMRRAGFVLAVALLLYPTSSWSGTGGTITLLLLATVVYTIGDLFHATAAAGLAYELALPHAIGQYQGVSGLLTGLAQAIGPALFTLLLLDGGTAGWVVLAVVFVATGLVTPALTARALARPPFGQVTPVGGTRTPG
ncbi:MFS transporter [Plantactinospora soyae]|uniref:MFS family permease n=1 Tax=Plantactinospora soyae TaxID=1544732 RepID=A0A927RA49_9ACTN|nr:MFS transporter [Plantactinospora soyae]MBE1490426.1 MFS family permease [Plantactinospora soyae]